MTLRMESAAFAHGSEIPRRFTCDDADVSPPLVWSGIPARSRSLVLIVDDPDAPDPRAPRMVYVHWLLYDIPTSAAGFPEGVQAAALPPGTREGLNDWKRTGYGGPCPPIGRHRYFFRLYALDSTLGDLGTPGRKELERAMRAHVVEQAELMGTYERTAD